MKIIKILGCLFYLLIAYASSTGNGPTDPKAACNEGQTSLNIRVQWINFPTYAFRASGCNINPGEELQSPLNSRTNAANENANSRGIVTVTFEPLQSENCEFARQYTSRQFFQTTLSDREYNFVETVPSGRGVNIVLEYQEACLFCNTNCNNSGTSRSIFKSTSSIPASFVRQGATIDLVAPKYDGRCNVCP